MGTSRCSRDFVSVSTKERLWIEIRWNINTSGPKFTNDLMTILGQSWTCDNLMTTGKFTKHL